MYKNLISGNKVSIILLYVFSFSIPLHQKLSTITLVVFAVIALFYIKRTVFRREFIALALLYPAYILFDVVNSGVFNFKILEMKASLLAFPFIFSIINYNGINIKKAYKSFILGCFVALVISYFYAFYRSLSFVEGALSFSPLVSGSSSNDLFLSSVREGHYFFGSHFSIFHQTVYFAMYLNIAIILLLRFGFFSRMIRIFLIVLFCIAIFQISNRANLLITPFSFIIYSLFFIKNKGVKWLFAASVFIIGLGVIITNPRIKQLYKQLTNSQADLNRESNDSLGTRLLIWDASLDLIAENSITGVGVTNAYEELKHIYKAKRYVIPYRHRLNTHNQFLQVTVECGIIGLIILLLQFMYIPFIKKRFDFLTAGILLIFLVNFVFESMLNRYSGIVCYAFFYCLLLLNSTTALKKEG